MSNEDLVLMIQGNEDKARHLGELYEQNRGAIAIIAKRYSEYAEIEDLMQESFFGLSEAAARWDPGAGANFLTYAGYWIRAAIINYLRKREPAAVSLSAPIGGESGELTLADVLKSDNDAIGDTIEGMNAGQLSAVLWPMVEELETRKEEKKARAIEEDVRAHLRGFARTIPSFIMAYSEQEGTGGGRNLKLSNFDDYTPDDVFKEVTGITEGEFRFLRDGGPYTDEATGKEMQFAGHVFDEVVFDESIQEFLTLKEKLNNYFADTSDEDIFDYIPPQKTNQIFTPKDVVVKMVDALEQENPGIFDDSHRTFADLYMKSGLYITEIVKRLFRSPALKKEFPDEQARLKHILENQVFGFAPSQIIYDIAIAYIFGFDKNANGISRRNFVMTDTTPYAKEGKLEELIQEKFGNRE